MFCLVLTGRLLLFLVFGKYGNDVGDERCGVGDTGYFMFSSVCAVFTVWGS